MEPKGNVFSLSKERKVDSLAVLTYYGDKFRPILISVPEQKTAKKLMSSGEKEKNNGKIAARKYSLNSQPITRNRVKKSEHFGSRTLKTKTHGTAQRRLSGSKMAWMVLVIFVLLSHSTDGRKIGLRKPLRKKPCREVNFGKYNLIVNACLECISIASVENA